MIAVDTQRGIVFRNDLLKSEVPTRQPIRRLARLRTRSAPPPGETQDPRCPPTQATGHPSGRIRPGTVARQRAYGYTAEDLRLIVNPMAEGQEPTWSMGDDAPLAVLSERPRPLHAFFRQRFAQVTNPAIDSLRERKVMALDSFMGRRGNLLAESADQARLLQLPSIAIDDGTMLAITELTTDSVAVSHDLDTVRDCGSGRVPDPGPDTRAGDRADRVRGRSAGVRSRHHGPFRPRH